jgi:hypothetical protein
VSPTDTSNVYDFYEPDPVTVYGGGSNDEETVMLQPVTYTGPAVESTVGTDPVAETPISVFDADMLSQSNKRAGDSSNQLGWK